MMAERGIVLAHTTILRWVQRYVPDFEKRWNRYALPVGDSWRADETYIKIKGQWVYLYRAVDRAGRTVDFFLSKRRDIAAAKRFFPWLPRYCGDNAGNGSGLLPKGLSQNKSYLLSTMCYVKL
jgi:transposase-like protein